MIAAGGYEFGELGAIVSFESFADSSRARQLAESAAQTGSSRLQSPINLGSRN